MAHLLDLPVEGRALILNLVLYSHREIPDQTCKREMLDGDAMSGLDIFTESDPATYTPNGRGLLLTNRKLRNETLNLTKRIKLTLFAEFRNWDLLPTWTCLPVLKHYTDVLEIHLRILKVRDSNWNFWFHDSEQPQIAVPLLYFIARFLVFGPAKAYTYERNSSLDFGNRIGLLDINILPLENFTKEDEKIIVSAQVTALRLYLYVKTMVKSTAFRNWSSLFYQRIEWVRVRVDGEIVEQDGSKLPDLDLTSLYAPHDLTKNWGDCSTH